MKNDENFHEMNFNKKINENKHSLAGKWDLLISKFLITFRMLENFS